jgi:hypothetical protein
MADICGHVANGTKPKRGVSAKSSTRRVYRDGFFWPSFWIASGCDLFADCSRFFR